MSGPPDNFLARWSRRKREVGEGPSATWTDPLPRGGTAQPDRGWVRSFPAWSSPPNEPLPSPSAQGGEQAQPAAPLKPLPRLEELTAESDLSAFMRAGVPKG
jgi:hypothetical protein